MPRLFGTDGVRGLANADLTPELALTLATAAARVLTAPPWSTAPAEAVARRESARRVAIELAGRGVEAPSDDSSDAPRFGERPFAARGGPAQVGRSHERHHGDTRPYGPAVVLHQINRMHLHTIYRST